MLKREAESKFPGNKSCQKTHTKKNPSKVYMYTEKFLVHCTINAERLACEVQCLLLKFLWLFCHPRQNVWRWTMHQASHQQRKSGRKYAGDFPFYGLWDIVFTAFGCNSSRDAFHIFPCSAKHRSLSSQSWHLFRFMFLQKRIVKEDHIVIYILHTQDLITMLKIWFCYSKV